ncbi:MAG TPA: hypothetical protein VK973_05860 [Arenicellales bacterium]|nr:hypothetical protein [Arenicellales bacterium]
MYRITVLHKRAGNPKKRAPRMIKTVQFAEDAKRGEENARMQFGEKFDYVVERV